MAGKHKCYVRECSRQIRVTLLMCAEHWDQVPRAARREVYAAWNAYNACISGDAPLSERQGLLDGARTRYLNAIKVAREAVECARTGALPRGSDVV